MHSEGFGMIGGMGFYYIEATGLGSSPPCIGTIWGLGV